MTHAPSRCRPALARVAGALLATAIVATSAAGQTDYYNTSAGRPLRIEDAMPVEYRALEIDVAPLRLERGGSGSYRWSVHPEIAAGLLPRTQFRLGVPLTYVDGAVGRRVRGISGLETSVLHSLNAETSIPALAVAADLDLPVGSLAGDATYATLEALATRTFARARVHANAAVTGGPEPEPVSGDATFSESHERSRWLAGIAIDRTFPLRSVLVGAEVVAEQPLRSEERVVWTAGTGVRLQLTPRWAFDAGAGRRMTGDDQAWYVTFGSAFALGIP